MSYTDKTWVFNNMKCKTLWVDLQVQSINLVYNITSGSGARLIFRRIGSVESEILDKFLLRFRSYKSNKSDDYHNEIYWDVFSDYCRKNCFSAIYKASKFF